MEFNGSAARFLLAILLLPMMPDASADSSNELSNGNFEEWDTLQGMPPSGHPAGWSQTCTNPPYQVPGLSAGSTYSVFMRPGVNNVLSQTMAGELTKFEFDFDFAALDPGRPSDRSFNVALSQKRPDNSTSIIVNLRMVAGTSPGILSLQAYDGQDWVTVGDNLFEASVYDESSNTFPTLNAYRISICLDLAAQSPTYSITYQSLGSADLSTIADLTVFHTLPSGSPLSGVSLQASGSVVGYAIDNMEIVPK